MKGLIICQKLQQRSENLLTLSTSLSLCVTSRSANRSKKQLEAEIKAAQEEIKQTMKANALEEMIADVFTIRYKPVVTSRFDTSKFKDKYRELYDSFCTPTESMKFTIT